jgi:hypothetical protein
MVFITNAIERVEDPGTFSSPPPVVLSDDTRTHSADGHFLKPDFWRFLYFAKPAGGVDQLSHRYHLLPRLFSNN